MPARNHHVSLTESEHHVVDPTNPSSALDDGIEHRLHIRRRAADDGEHLARCRLMLQRFAQFRIAFLDLLEQPYVFNSDDRLVGEGLEERYLLFGKGTDFGSANLNGAYRDSFAKQWHNKG